MANVYDQRVARAPGLDTGANRQGGGSTPLGVTAGLVAGMSTPISSNLSPEMEAELKAKYMRLYGDITIEEQRLQRETVETYGSLSSSLLSARANLLSATAEGAKAKAMSDQAVADAMGIYDGMADMSAELLYFEPDKDSWSEWMAKSNQMDASIVSSMSDATGYGVSVNESTSPEVAGEVFTKALVDTAVRADDQLLSTMIEHSNALSGDPERRTVTLQQEYGSYKAQIRQGYDTMAQMSGYQMSQEELESLTNGFMARYVDPVVFGDGAAGSGLLTQQDLSVHQMKMQTAAEKMTALDQRLDGMGAGLDPRLIQEAQMSLRQAEQVVSGGPMAFADMTMNMPTPEGTAKTKAMIERELARLEQGPIDPLVQAKQDIMAVPGFDVWMQAMGFTNVTRAMLYAGNHPYEFKTAIKAYVQGSNGTAPESTTTPAGMREYLRMQGDKEGLGFHVTPLERAFSKVTGNRNFSWPVGRVRERLEGYEPRTTFGEGIKDRLAQAFGIKEVERMPTDYEGGQHVRGLDGESHVDVIEADVARRERHGLIQDGPLEDQVQDPGFRDVDGAGGYTYRQYADGRLEIINTPSGSRTIPVQPGSNAEKAILREIGAYPIQQQAPGGQAPAPGEQGLDLEMDLEGEKFAKMVSKLGQVSHPPGKDQEGYTLVKLGDEDGGWTVRLYGDQTIQVVDAPGFDEQVGQAFAAGSFQHNELSKGISRAPSKTEVSGSLERGEDIVFGEVKPDDVKVERAPAQRAATQQAPQARTIRLYWKPPGDNPVRVQEVVAGSEDEAWWRSQGAYEEGKKGVTQVAAPKQPKPEPKKKPKQPKAPKAKAQPLDPVSMLAEGFPESSTDTGTTSTGASW